ncbi:MAG: hypothetical protein QOI48_60 [Solirubrobacteraceae bacterium]|nr:hypothetical protein [Solirubrobacteraceae bacterium]
MIGAVYCFRIRFFLSGPLRINLSKSEVALAKPSEDGELVVLRAHGLSPPPISSTSHLIVEGRDYDTSAEALDAGEHWRGILEKAFAASNLGADFGDRGPTSVLTDVGARVLEVRLGHPVMNDTHGVMAYQCEPRPRFVSTSATLTAGRSGEHLLRAIAEARAAGARLSAQERVAYDLYSASFSVSAADARFVLLMMAVETLLKLLPRADAVRAHVEDLISLTESTDIPQGERASIVGTLRWLFNESISQGGRRLASTLEERTYSGETPGKFFTGCYDLRSKLVHGSYPRPTFEEVNVKAGALECFVRDLLAGEFAP